MIRTSVYFLCSALFVFISLGLASPQAFAFPLRGTLSKTTTEHFEIIHQKDHQALANHYAWAAETAYNILAPIFIETPKRTIIILNDQTDLANGLATFVPYPMIVANVALPTIHDSIDDYGDWALELMIHEYTHILNMHPRHGIYVPFRWILGDVVRPNAVLPKWYLEGLAVWTESRFSSHGRLRSLDSQADARALTLGQNWQRETLPTINEQSLPTWPRGARPYIFGGWWWQEALRGLSEEETQQKLAEANQVFARRLPFLINYPIRTAFARSPNEILQAAQAKQKAKAERQLTTIQALPGPTSSEFIQNSPTQNASEDFEERNLAISPNGLQLAHTHFSPSAGHRLYLRVRPDNRQSFARQPARDLGFIADSVRLIWLNDYQLLMDQIPPDRRRDGFRKVYIFDVGSGDQQVLNLDKFNHEISGQEASPSPDGKSWVYVANESGQQSLRLLQPLDATKHIKRTTKTLVRGGLGQRLSSPAFLNDYKILFVYRSKKGHEQIYFYDLVTKKSGVWNASLKSTQNLKIAAGGVLTTNADEGVRNVFWLSADGRMTKKLSQTSTTIHDMDWDASTSELLVSEMTSRGVHLKALQQTPDLESYPPIEATTWPGAELAEAALVVLTTPKDIQRESYSPWGYLWPRYWIPFIYPVDRGLLFQGTTSTHDPAEHHHLTWLGSYDTVTSKPSYGVNYLNQASSTDVALNYFRAQSFLSASQVFLENQSAGFKLTPAWPFDSKRKFLSFGGSWDQTLSRDFAYRRLGPKAEWQWSARPQKIRSHLRASHQEFVEQQGYLAYGRSAAAGELSANLGAGLALAFRGRGALAPQQPFSSVVQLGDRSIGAPFLVTLANSDYLFRGYPNGAFLGRKILNSNLELSLRPWRIDHGKGSFPVFLRELEVTAFLDTVAVDGAGYRTDIRGYSRRALSQHFFGTGAELKLNTTTAYHLPVSLILGLYVGLDSRFGGGFSPFLGLGVGELPGLGNKTP